MYLHEEYFARHSIDSPLMKIPQKTTLIFRGSNRFKEKWESQWAIFQITKVQEVQYRPCHFVFKLGRPVHNGSDNPNPLNPILKDVNIYFEEYEQKILSYGEKFIKMGLEPINSLAEAKVTAWEIFLYCNDYRLSLVPIRLRDALWTSIDKELSIGERMRAQEEVVKGLQYEPTLSSRWEVVKRYCDPINYADWCAKVIHNIKSQSSYLSTFSDIKNIA